MNWIQVLLITAVVTLLVYLVRSRGNAKTKAWVKVGYLLFVIAAVYAILRPDDTTVVANWSGWIAAPISCSTPWSSRSCSPR